MQAARVKQSGIQKMTGALASRQLAAIVESSHDAIIGMDSEGLITSWNSAAERLYGHTAPEIMGRPVTILLPPERLKEEVDILERIHRGERIEHYETVRRRKDGSLVDVSLSVSPVTDDQGGIIGASKIARDISERKQNEKALAQAQAQLANRTGQLEKAVAERTAELTAINQQLETFVYTIAHDFRAPLRSMEGFASILLIEEGEALSEQGRDFARRISRSAKFMDALLNDLLAFSRLSQERIELVPVDLETVMHATLFRLESEIQEKHARVEASDAWPSVLAHELVLGQLVFNLVNNALKFVAPVVKARVRVRED